MKKFSFLFSILMGTCFFAQMSSEKLGFFSSVEANVGFDLAHIIKENQAVTDYEKAQVPPGKFNYGFHAQAGYQPLNWFSLAGGLRYSYIDPNFHLLYVTLQPNFYISDPMDEYFEYLFASIGQKINRTAAENAGFAGIGFGKMTPLTTRFGQKFQLYLEDQLVDGNGSVFVGLSYGIVLFSNKNL